jgi:hypothetical protein
MGQGDRIGMVASDELKCAVNSTCDPAHRKLASTAHQCRRYGNRWRLAPSLAASALAKCCRARDQAGELIGNPCR